MLGSSRAPKEQSTPDVINAMFGRDAVAKRRTKFKVNTVKGHYQVTNSDCDQWQTDMDEFLFQYITQNAGAGMDGNIMQVLPSLDGLDPNKIWDTVRYAGLSVQSVPYKVNGRIAVKMSGKARIQNTGKETFRPGQAIELYSMTEEDSAIWKATDPRKRIVPGVRPYMHGKSHVANLFDTTLASGSDITKNLIKDTLAAITLYTGAPSDGKLRDLAGKMEHLRVLQQPRIIGIALAAARPKQYFEILLSQQVPG